MKKVLVKSKQPDVVAKHNSPPVYEIKFSTESVEVTKEVAEHLLLNPTFELIETKKTKKGEPE